MEDAVDAYLHVAASLDGEQNRGRAWNAGWGTPHSVLDIVRRLIAVSGIPLEPDVQGEGVSPGEIDRQYLESTALREELGWRPSVDLDDGLRRTWRWYQQRFEG